MIRFDADERRLFEAAIERFAADQYSLARCRSGDMECSQPEWRRFAAQGLLAIGIPPALGGVGGGASELAAVMREIGRNLLSPPFLDSVVVAVTAIHRFASEAQAGSRLPMIAQGDLRTGFAHLEARSGNDRHHVEAQLAQGRISGAKSFVLDATTASEFIVSAREERGDLRLCFVAAGSEGLSLQTYRLPDGRLAAAMTLENVSADPMPRVADLDRVLDLAAVCVAAEAVGAIEAINQETLAYAKTRRQFGSPIGSFQILQHRLVDMLIAAEEASAIVIDALEAIDSDAPDAAFLVSAAKAHVDKAGRFVAESAIQVHGGMGMTDECAVGHHLKRLLTIGSQFGTADWHMDRVARLAALTRAAVRCRDRPLRSQGNSPPAGQGSPDP
jgi:alkylation response protein AidB-like acyl-CoA dehydrogenase